MARIEHRDLFRFEHDLFEDWCIYRFLNQHRESLVSLLESMGEPLGLMRSLTLLGESLIEHKETADYSGPRVDARNISSIRALGTRNEFGTDSLPRRRQLASNPRSTGYWKAPKAILLGCYLAFLAEEIEPNLSLVPNGVSAAVAGLSAILSMDPVPRKSTWSPIIGFLMEHWEPRVPTLGRWPYEFSSAGPSMFALARSRRAIAELVASQFAALPVYRHGDDYDALVSIVLETCDVAPGAAIAFLAHYSRNGAGPKLKYLTAHWRCFNNTFQWSLPRRCFGQSLKIRRKDITSGPRIRGSTIWTSG